MTYPSHSARSLILLSGDDRLAFLQGLLTQDVTRLAADKIQFAAMLSPQGKILHDMFLIAVDNGILIDTQAAYKDALLKRLSMYKLRAKVMIEEIPSHHTLLATQQPLPDPRHPELPPYSPPATRHAPLSLGIPELGRDFAPDEVTALDAGYDLLHAVSFTKGCYVGQEITARMHYKNIARKGFFILEQQGAPVRLALLKFEDVIAQNGTVTVDNQQYTARLPGWMTPQWEKFRASLNNQ